jgi:hypothetical protein
MGKYVERYLLKCGCHQRRWTSQKQSKNKTGKGRGGEGGTSGEGIKLEKPGDELITMWQ